MLVDCIVGVPTDSTGAFAGCQLLPAALRRAGLGEWDVEDLGNLQVVLADPERDPETGIVSLRDLVSSSAVIRNALRGLALEDRRPLVLGGDCTLLIGAMAGLRSARPDTGLVFIDGHFDTYTAATSETGDGADLEMSILLGDGPPVLTEIGGAMDPSRIAIIGPRDDQEMADHGATTPRDRAGIYVADEARVQAAGGAVVAGEALTHLGGAGASRFWVHVDLDVLDSASMPAVDYPQPGGLDWTELSDLVRPAVCAPGFAGLSVVILNPSLDGAGEATARTAEWLSDVLAD